MKKLKFRVAAVKDFPFISDIIDETVVYDDEKCDEIIKKIINGNEKQDDSLTPEFYVYSMKKSLSEAIDNGNEEVIASEDEDKVPDVKVFIVSIDGKDIAFCSYYQRGESFFVGYWGLISDIMDHESLIVQGACDLVKKNEGEEIIHIQIDNRFENEAIILDLFPNLKNQKHDPEYIMIGSRML